MVIIVQAKGWGIDKATSDRLFAHVVRTMHGAKDDLKEMRGDTYMDKLQLAGAYAMIKEDLLDTIRKWIANEIALGIEKYLRKNNANSFNTKMK